MAQPATQNLVLVRGDTETLVITMTDSAGLPIDITGRTYRAQIRVQKDAASIAASFACSITNAAAGQVTCVLTATNSASLVPGVNYWDFEENNAGVVTTVLAGTAQVLADVTR